MADTDKALIDSLSPEMLIRLARLKADAGTPIWAALVVLLRETGSCPPDVDARSRAMALCAIAGIDPQEMQ